jgi:hypothetical protein
MGGITGSWKFAPTERLGASSVKSSTGTGVPSARTENFVPLAWESDDTLTGEMMLERMRAALRKPVLDGNALPSSPDWPGL